MAAINLLLVHKLSQYQVCVPPTLTFGQLKVRSFPACGCVWHCNFLETTVIGLP